jgi:hypothetical protein
MTGRSSLLYGPCIETLGRCIDQRIELLLGPVPAAVWTDSKMSIVPPFAAAASSHSKSTRRSIDPYKPFCQGRPRRRMEDVRHARHYEMGSMFDDRFVKA